MKRFISFLLALVILFSIAAPTVNIAYAAGDQNYTGGDYDLDYLNPTGSYWDVTLQGIRISLFDCNTKKVTKTIDYSNHTGDVLANYPLSYQDPATGQYISLTANVARNWYGYVDKLQYMKGKGLAKQVGRQYQPKQFRDGSGNILTFPNCIVNEKSNYAAVKKFFTDEDIARTVAKDFGMIPADTLITTDRYKIILEPVVYFCWCNQWYAMTATEAAVYDKTYGPMNAVTVDGKSYRRMMKLTRGMVQLCMYLEKDDTVVGIAAYHGTQSEQEPTISIPKLGVGIISFAELLQASDKAKFKLTIIKKDSVTGARLAGAKFNIYDPLLKKTFKVTTDSNGEATVYCALPNYYNKTFTAIEITETKAPEGYVLNPTKRVFGRSFWAIYHDNLKATYTIKNDPIEDQEDEPIDGDNIVWAYQLTESFTNDTNFNSRPSWRGAPTLHSCSKGYTSYSGTTDYYPNIPNDAYDISVKANDIYEDVPDGNGGTIEVYSHTEYDYSYKISHDSSHLIGIIWNGQPGGNGSTEVEIPASTYIAGSVFSDNSNMNEYKILHNGSNYMLQFEGFGGPRGITYSIPRYQDIFAELADTLKTWISHRNGGLTRQAQELPLASYMSSQNAAYKSFYSRYTGNTATERASNSSNPAFYGSTNNINTHTTHGGNLRRWYTGYYCNDGHSNGDPVVYDELHTGTTTSNPRQTYRYAVEGSYKKKDR